MRWGPQALGKAAESIFFMNEDRPSVDYCGDSAASDATL